MHYIFLMLDSVNTNRLKVYMNYERTLGNQIDLFVYLKVPPNFCEASPVSEARCGTFSDACQNLNVSDGFHVKASRDARRKFQLALVINLCFVSYFYHPLLLCSTPLPPPLFPPLLAFSDWQPRRVTCSNFRLGFFSFSSFRLLYFFALSISRRQSCQILIQCHN